MVLYGDEAKIVDIGPVKGGSILHVRWPRLLWWSHSQSSILAGRWAVLCRGPSRRVLVPPAGASIALDKLVSPSQAYNHDPGLVAFIPSRWSSQEPASVEV